MIANSLAILNQQTLGRTDYVHCFQAQLTESCLVCLVLGRQENRLLFLSL